MYRRYIKVHIFCGFIMWFLTGFFFGGYRDFSIMIAFGLAGALVGFLSLCSLELLSGLPDWFDDTTPRYFAITITGFLISPAMGILASLALSSWLPSKPGLFIAELDTLPLRCIIFGFLSLFTFEFPRSMTLSMSPIKPHRKAAQ